MPQELLDGLIAAATPLLPSMIHRHSSSLPRLVPAEHAAELPALGAAALPMALLLRPSLAAPGWTPPGDSPTGRAAANPALALLGVALP